MPKRPPSLAGGDACANTKSDIAGFDGKFILVFSNVKFFGRVLGRRLINEITRVWLGEFGRLYEQ